MASTVITIGSPMPASTLSQVSHPIGPASGPELTARIAITKATTCSRSTISRSHIMRSSGAGESLGVTRYQCPNSIASLTAPRASAARIS